MACLLGHLAATGERLVHSATFMVAGLDTAQESQIGMLALDAAWRRRASGRSAPAYLDGDDLAKVFAWLRPNDLVWNYWVNNYLLGQNPPAFDILFWNADTTRLPAGLHSDFLDLFVSNGLAAGTITVLGTPVELGKVDIDTYVVAGSTDHIIPWRTAYRTTQLLGGESEFVLSSSGHIQAIVNPPGNPKASYFTGDGTPPPDANEWLDEPNSTAVRGGTTGPRGSTAVRANDVRADAARQHRAPAAGTGARPLRPPQVSARGTGPHFVRVDGHLIRVSIRGEGRPLLLIMGLGGNIEMWDPLERALNARGVQTIAYDASGTGESPPRSSVADARSGPPGRAPARRPRPSSGRRARRVVRRCGRAGARARPTRTGYVASCWCRRCAGSAVCRATRSRCRSWRPRCATTRPRSCG